MRALLDLAGCTTAELYQALLAAFTARKFFLSFDTFSETLDDKFRLGSNADLSSASVRNIVVGAFEALDCFGTEFVTLVDLQLVLLSPDEQKAFHHNLRRIDVRRLNSGLNDAERELLEDQQLPAESATLFYHLLQRCVWCVVCGGSGGCAVLVRKHCDDARRGIVCCTTLCFVKSRCAHVRCVLCIACARMVPLLLQFPYTPQIPRRPRCNDSRGFFRRAKRVLRHAGTHRRLGGDVPAVCVASVCRG